LSDAKTDSPRGAEHNSNKRCTECLLVSFLALVLAIVSMVIVITKTKGINVAYVPHAAAGAFPYSTLQSSNGAASSERELRPGPSERSHNVGRSPEGRTEADRE
jgi:hypothetical protein